MILIRFFCLLNFAVVFVNAQAFASYLCRKQWKCEQYQREKLGPNYSFSFVKPTIVKDSDVPNGDLQGTYLNPLVKINPSNKNFKNSFWQTGKISINFQDSNFEHAVMRGFSAQNISITNINFHNADLLGSNFTGSRFLNVNLQNANLKFSDLGFVQFINTNLQGVNLSDCNLIGTQFINVKINSKTLFPPNFDLKRLKP